jgi:hypothetical protein
MVCPVLKLREEKRTLVRAVKGKVDFFQKKKQQGTGQITKRRARWNSVQDGLTWADWRPVKLLLWS